MISKEKWESFYPGENPFLTWEFFSALSESGCLGEGTRWDLVTFFSQDNKSCLYTFIKDHSYGEFIFDWSWARAYETYGIPYYPKLTSMVPYTPVTTQHFLMKEFDEKKAQELLTLHEEYYESSGLSSAHFLFITQKEISLFETKDYLIRESIQYHFFNENYENFESFLGQLKSRKAKQIRSERRMDNIVIKRITGEGLTEEHALRMYKYYISTIAEKNSFDYLNESFFKIIFKTMKDKILFVEAYEDNKPIAGALYFYDQKKLYGRYWGSFKYVPHLHFELCYYQGIDFTIENKLSLFEAGAQGEHKIARGFRPVRMYSAHKLRHPAFHEAVKTFIAEEKKQLSLLISELSEGLPFRSG